MGRGPSELVGAGEQACLQALTFPVDWMPLMTHRYTIAQQAAKWPSSRRGTEPLSLMSAVTFRACRSQK